MNYKRRVLRTSVILCLVLVFSSLAVAALPAKQGFVNDFANVIDQKYRAEMHLLGEKLWTEQGIGLAVVTVATTAPLDPKEYTTALFNEWGVGGADDSGLVMLLAVSEGAIEVEPGYGLEGVLPDGLVGAVIDQEGLPHFKKQAYGAGLAAMAVAYANILAGEEFEIAEEQDRDNGWFISFVIFVLLLMLMRRGRRYPPGGSGGLGGGGGSRGPVIIPRMPRGGGFGGGSRPSGGFGGGRSGGGGAGRRF
ncbi:MAG: TPM domain-containing protein [Limnochordia bacterium]|jgi:uncharacterized protein|nr:TPM domain-containing protein [Limnochordia bacterium]